MLVKWILSLVSNWGKGDVRRLDWSKSFGERSAHPSGFLGGSVVKNPPDNARDAGSIPRSGRFPVKGNSNPLMVFLGNPMDREAWWATVHGVAKEPDMT